MKKKLIVKKLIAILVMLPLLSSCVPSVANFQECIMNPIKCYNNLSAPEKSLIEGIGVGATVGSVGAIIAGGDRKKIAKWAAIGGGIGGLGAMWYQKKLEKEKAALEKEEANLDVRITYAQKVNADSQRYNVSLKKEIQDTKVKIVKINKDYQAGLITKEQLDEERSKITGRMVEAKENERVLKESLADLKEYRKKKIASKSKEKDNSKIKEIETKIAALDIEINRLEKTLEEVSKNTMILASTEYE